MITVTATTSPITATAGASSVSATVAATSVSATATGGVGPPGASVSNLGDLADVQLDGLVDGDVLRRDGGAWTNYSDDLLVDGGNF